MTPPRLLNALIDASSVDFCWGNESPPAVLVAGEIDPTLIVPPADCRGATAPAETGTSSAVAATTTITATTVQRTFFIDPPRYRPSAATRRPRPPNSGSLAVRDATVKRILTVSSSRRLTGPERGGCS